jgi:hypothetical protein
MNEISIPEKCRTCPKLLDELGHLNYHEKLVGELILNAVSDDLKELGTGIYDNLVRMDATTSLGFDSPEVVTLKIRQEMSKDIDDANKHIDDIRASMAALTLGCPGSLKLRAEKSRLEYLVTICASPTSDDTETEPAIVKRTRVSRP